MSPRLKIVSFNVRCTWDEADGFVSRMGLIYDKIQKEAPDIVAFQEITDSILKGLERIMPEYFFVGHGRNSDYGGEALYIAINRDSVRLIGMDSFWIAPDPFDKKSRFADQSPYPRICVSAALYHPSSGREFRVYNVHLDHIGAIAKAEGMKCVLEKVREHNRRCYMPTIVLGDFNEEPGGVATGICNQWAEPVLYDITRELPGTFHAYGGLTCTVAHNKKIDYMFATQELKNSLASLTLWEDKLNGHWLSDHYPVCVEFC